MSNSPRDTQFKNFAKLLLDELCLASDVHIETPFNDDWREEWEEAIAQRAYDLVEHSIKLVKHKCENERWDYLEIADDVEEIMPDIPDLIIVPGLMTELPKED